MVSSAGCLPASTFTSARPLPKGTFEHVAAIDVTGSRYAARDSTVGVVPSYALRYGLTERVELGARYSSLASAELSGKIGLVRGPRFALAIAPRVTTTTWLQPVYGRVPILATFQLSERVNLTPRLGLGGALGTGRADIEFSFSAPANEYRVRHPLGEAGATLLVRVAPRVSLGVDVYGLSTFPDPIVTAGGGFAVLFGAPQATQR